MTDEYKVIYSPAAHDDLEAIYAYVAYELLAEPTAGELTTRIRKEIRSLSTFPERNSPVDWEPWASMKMRKMPVGNFVVYYTVDTEKRIVTVVRIFYGGRDAQHIISMQ